VLFFRLDFGLFFPAVSAAYSAEFSSDVPGFFRNGPTLSSSRSVVPCARASRIFLSFLSFASPSLYGYG
jgi:hypothetical protein